MKIYKNYLIKFFLQKIFNVSLVFFFLIFILSIFEEITYFKDLNVNFLIPILASFLNAPSTLFEIFPFIFLIGTQFFFIGLINKNELEIFKVHGLNNLKIIKILFFTSFILGLLLTLLFYNFAAKLKFSYLDLKNDYSTDNKYLTAVTENGLWIKDEINEKIYITNANSIVDEYLYEVFISEFDSNFNLLQTIKSQKININTKVWVIFKPNISMNNNTVKYEKNIFLASNFDKIKIYNSFENLTSLTLFTLGKTMDDYKNLGYSVDEIQGHIYKLRSLPIFLSLMTVFASVLMFNVGRSKSTTFHLMMGILLSVIIYYVYYLFNLLGVNGKIPTLLSVSFPLFILSITTLIGLVRINEK